MKIKNIKLKNFRGYHNEVPINFEDLTVFVGKNDIGKSSILEALDIFFNDTKAIVKLDKDDINIDAHREGDNEISITVCFTELPEQIVIDSTNNTSLSAEYLLNEDGDLEIIKKYPNAGSPKVYIRALHPTNAACADLLQKKDADLRKMVETLGIQCVKTTNASMRSAIWNYYSDSLDLNTVELDTKKVQASSLWDKLQTYMPIYSLFQADRKNSDGDSEVQDPLKEAVKEILHDESLRNTLNSVATIVEQKLREVSDKTLEKLQEMSPDIANTLKPVIPPAESLKWADVFKNVSIAGDENIPINKRGSGSKRLILLNFFRAQVEHRQSAVNAPSVIYAIEEPETSQHSDNQIRLIHALEELSRASNTQVILTTHSPVIVKELGFNNIRIIRMLSELKAVENTLPNELPYPSLNEVNYLAFSEISESYHNELYGYIEEQGLMGEYKQGKTAVRYIRLKRDNTQQETQVILTEYIRHQIHHPENILNPHFTPDQLRESIELMRAFIHENI